MENKSKLIKTLEIKPQEEDFWNNSKDDEWTEKIIRENVDLDKGMW